MPTSGPTLGCSRPQPHGAFHTPHRPRPQGSVRAPASGRWRGCWGHSPGSQERCSLSDLWHPQLAKGGRGASRRSMEAEIGWPRHTAARGQLRTEPPTHPDLGLLRQQPLLTASAWGSAPPRRARGWKLTGKHGDLTRARWKPALAVSCVRMAHPAKQTSVLRAVSHTFTSKPEIQVQWDSPAATPVNALPCILHRPGGPAAGKSGSSRIRKRSRFPQEARLLTERFTDMFSTGTAQLLSMCLKS